MPFYADLGNFMLPFATLCFPMPLKLNFLTGGDGSLSGEDAARVPLEARLGRRPRSRL